MAFPDAVTQALTGGADAPEPTTATNPPATPAPEPSTVSAPSTLTPPAQPQVAQPRRTMQPATQPQPEQPEAPGEHFRNLSHALKGALLGVVAAGPRHVVDHYEADESGKMTPVMRPTHAADRLKLLAQSALQGLAAGSRVPPQRSKAAALAAGLGAGAEAVRGRGQEQDLLKRKQAQEQFEQEQRAIMNRATIAEHNARMYGYWTDNLQKQNDLDDDRKMAQELKAGIDAYNAENPTSPIKAQVLTEDEAHQLRQGDHTPESHPLGNTAFFGYGRKFATDENGQRLLNHDGSPKEIGQVLAISGLKPDAQIPLPQSFVDQLQKYAKTMRGSGYEQFKAGQLVPALNFVRMNSMLTEAKQKQQQAVEAGWQKPEIVKVNGRLMKYNAAAPEGEQLREYPQGATPLAGEKEVADIAEKKAGAFQKTKEGEKAAEETKQLQEWDTGGPNGTGRIDVFGNPVGAPGMDKKEYLKRVDAFTKDYSKDLNQLDAARSQLSDIIKNAEKTKKLPGADAVVGIFDAIGISSAPLKGRGFRINNSVVSEHVEGTRNAWQNMALKLSRLTPEGTGQIVSLEQLKDYERIMDQARQDAYVGAANDAVNRGIGIQFAPRGNGAAIDANTMRIFLTMAKGDPVKASAIAKQYGWTPPR